MAGENKQMDEVHLGELDQFVEIFKDYGISRIDDRLKVLKAFLQTESHVSAGDLAVMLDGLREGFVAETLDILASYGFAHKAVFDGQPTRYEHRHIDIHHDHLICTQCGKIEEFHHRELERLKERVALDQGFMMLTHRMDIYGLCSQCQQRRRKFLPLTEVRPGERVRVMDVAGGREMVRRAGDLGLIKGATVEIIKSDGPGPVVVAALGSRVALGRRMAERVMVAPAKPAA